MSAYERHLAEATEREYARIEAQQERELAEVIEDLTDAEPYDPSEEHDYFADGEAA